MVRIALRRLGRPGGPKAPAVSGPRATGAVRATVHGSENESATAVRTARGRQRVNAPESSPLGLQEHNPYDERMVLGRIPAAA